MSDTLHRLATRVCVAQHIADMSSTSSRGTGALVSSDVLLQYAHTTLRIRDTVEGFLVRRSSQVSACKELWLHKFIVIIFHEIV